jgi:hypothetical protein
LRIAYSFGWSLQSCSCVSSLGPTLYVLRMCVCCRLTQRVAIPCARRQSPPALRVAPPWLALHASRGGEGKWNLIGSLVCRVGDGGGIYYDLALLAVGSLRGAERVCAPRCILVSPCVCLSLYIYIYIMNEASTSIKMKYNFFVQICNETHPMSN